jgi:asparagine synthase (glutamine-hydrolysing)
MCGILGAMTLAGTLPSEERVSKALDRMRNRGPDDSGTWRDTAIVLGHRRLSVLDVSQAGHQPMISEDGRFVVVFNGEIFNHNEIREELRTRGAWRSNSDTETLLEAYSRWGAKCVERFNGMFAFAIWDKREKSLFLARDRLGVKPLYYSWDGKTLAFASRPGPLASILSESKPQYEENALRTYLELGYVPSPLAFFRGMKKVPQAHHVVVNASGLRVVRYWDYRHITPESKWNHRPEGELLDELGELFSASVRSRLLSDVPLGAFLSGGVDSGLVLASMKAVGVDMPKAFTIAFREKEYDEGPAAAAIARHIGVDHVVETLGVNDLLALLPKFVDEFDEPLADSSAFPTMAVAQLARRDVTVALTGDGGDELFGGYHYYPLMDRLADFNSTVHPVRFALRQLLAVLPSHRVKLLSHALNFEDPIELFQYMRSMSKDFAPFATQELLNSTSSSVVRFMEAASSFPLELAASEVGMRLDMRFTLADDYLQKVDVATMASSVEARNPFLDFRLVEWAMRLPLRYKIRNGETKYLLKKLLSRSLPESLVYKPKRGFGVPVAAWLRGPLQQWALQLIHDRQLIDALPIDRNALLKVFGLHISRRRDAHPILWSTLMLLCFTARHIQGRDLPTLESRKAA